LVTAAVEMPINAFATTVEPRVDAVAARIEAPRGDVAIGCVSPIRSTIETPVGAIAATI
jgi:hypothetical protein